MLHRNHSHFCYPRLAALLVLVGVVLCAPARSGGLGISPTLIDLPKSEQVGAIQVQNLDPMQPVGVQTRVLRWQQDENGDVYDPTDTVIASPPMTLVMGGAENMIRVVRTSKDPIRGEESYRLLIDQLPTEGEQQGGTVSVLVRHVVPVFFSHPDASPAQMKWQIRRVLPSIVNANPRPSGWEITAQNLGDKRLRMVDLVLRDEAGQTLGKRPGLVCYVLGRSQVKFFVPQIEHQTKYFADKATLLRLSVDGEGETIETELLPVAAN